jgi:hypothetical protein
MATRNYLNNRDLLLEIHKSKTSYSYYIDDHAKDFDAIVDSVNSINKEVIKEARKARADRIQRAAFAKNEDKKLKLANFAVDPESFEVEELVFRVMTFEHVPLDPTRKKNPKSVADHHAKCLFPPYYHYRYNVEGELDLCGKSHWQGGLDNGWFSQDHGRTTNKLANMYMKLCERYSHRYNWRGYTYVDEMRGQALVQLAQIGLQFDESKSNNPFAYYTAAITNSFTRVLNIEKRNQNIRDDILEMNDLTPSYTRQHSNEFKTETAAEAKKDSK